jgi:hypothetical protein
LLKNATQQDKDLGLKYLKLAVEKKEKRALMMAGEMAFAVKDYPKALEYFYISP